VESARSVDIAARVGFAEFRRTAAATDFPERVPTKKVVKFSGEPQKLKKEEET
jgi:hypothetical protein